MFRHSVQRARRWQALLTAFMLALGGIAIIATAKPAAACAGDCGESKTVLNVDRTQLRYGEVDTFSAAVFDKSDSCGWGDCDDPTGSVEFSVRGASAPFATAQFAHTYGGESITEAVKTSALPAGSPEVVARYVPGGSAPFNRSESSFVLRVTPAPTKITVSQSSDTSVTGELVGIYAKVEPTVAVDRTLGAHAPSGFVTIQDQPGNGAPDIDLGTAPLDSNGVAALVTNRLARGYTLVNVRYAGDGDYARASDSAVVHDVEPASTTTAVTSSSNPSGLGESVTFTTRVSTLAPGAGTPDGTVQFRDGTANLGAPQPLSGGVASVTAVLRTGGTHTITAVYSGSSNYNPSTSPEHRQTVACTRTITGSQASVDIPASGSTCVSNASITRGITIPAGATVSIVNSTVGGGLTSTGGARAISVCKSTFGGNVSISGATGFLLLGDVPEEGCAGNQFRAGVTLASNTSGLNLGDNRIGGTVSITNNQGFGPGPNHYPPEVEANTIGGRLTCTGNSPVAANDGRTNSAAGRSGECGAAGF